ncbi:MAG: glycosyltransferase family 39 protein [Acidobacteria bacterium]|nr:glycosyltransferase family 39 protein [Acidobacteriota bacterium]
MTNLKDEHSPQRRRTAALVFLAVVVLGVVLYTADMPGNPPGFYIDESSIAYNAHLIATTGSDEHGTSWPLFFRAFGDYKNPVYVYLLAALFRLTGPSIVAARLLSVALGLLAALALGLLAARLTKRREAAPLVALSALLTPWLFELSRVVIEVALYPLAVALFLLCVHRAASAGRWTWGDAARLAATLALLTYSYSVGRLLGPLLALGLALFATRANLLRIFRVWLVYALSLVPLFVYGWRHPGVLTGRFQAITYLSPQSTSAETALEFLKHYSGNLDVWRLLVTGDPNVNQIASIHGVTLVLAATFALSLAGAWLALRRGTRDAAGRRWWLFVLYGLAASVVPASLTNEYFHMLRLAAVPVFLLVLTAPAFAWLLEERAAHKRARRTALILLVSLTLAQGAVFQWQYHAHARAPRRTYLFDSDYAEKILAPTLDAPQRPIYLADALAVPGYIHAYWHATLRGAARAEFVLLAPDASPPVGALVISTEESCPRCRIIARRDPYTPRARGCGSRRRARRNPPRPRPRRRDGTLSRR